ncbi:MAG: CBS domain-containing protein [Candidatus Riflebacteria bacterium]|nr:CBS domain-containing protein [Candidatus Riflebacteria bacterium]
MPFIWIEKGIRRNIPVEEPVLRPNKVLAPSKARMVTLDQPGQPVLPDQPEHQTFTARLAQQSYEGGQHPVSQQHKVIQAYEIMSKPVVTLPPSATLTQAWLLIRDHRFQHIPIVDSAGALLGILCDRTLLRLAVTMGWDITRRDDPNDPEQTVEKHFSAPVLTTLPHAEIHQIARILFDEHIGAMPVIDNENIVIGIITRSDILRALGQLGAIEIWG